MERKVRVGAVSYLNTKPLVFGIEMGMMKESLELMSDYPSKVAELLRDDTIDVGLIPIAAIKDLKEHYIITDYCIGCDGEVGSVCLFSDVPLKDIENVLLDYQSRTSVELLKILMSDHWKIDPVIITSTEEYRHNIKGGTAGLVIGDRAFEQGKISAYTYDLGYEWKKFTGLPFVFACWISNKPLDADFIDAFSKANAWGLAHIEDVVRANPYPLFDLKKYYSQYVSYVLDDEKRKGMRLFLDLINNKALKHQG